MQKIIQYIPYLDSSAQQEVAPWINRHLWPSKWITLPNCHETPLVAVYRCTFYLDIPRQISIHVSADERYELFVDGQREGRGSEKGDGNNWFYETYELDLTAGQHIISARVCSYGPLRAASQMSLYHGLIVSPEKNENIQLLGTGVALWEVKKVSGYSFIPLNELNILTGARIKINGQVFDWDAEKGSGSGWIKAVNANSGISKGGTYFIEPGTHMMTPAMMQPQVSSIINKEEVRFAKFLDESEMDQSINESHNSSELCRTWQNILEGSSGILPNNTVIYALIDLKDYFCAYSELTTTGGTDCEISIKHSESMYFNQNGQWQHAMNRDTIDTMHFVGTGDTFITDGGNLREFNSLWWNAGRYIEIIVKTKENPIIINSLKFIESRYPLMNVSHFTNNDSRYQVLEDICFRTLQNCCHDTYMDCPYWEQLMYVGDTRVQVLITYACTTETLLPKKAIDMFRLSQLNHTYHINCAYPQNGGKIITSFGLWWICMLYDLALWKGEKAYLRELIPAARHVMDTFINHRGEDGLIHMKLGWDYHDTALGNNSGWQYGQPPDSEKGVNGLLNWQVVYTLRLLSKLEAFMDEIELVERWNKLAQSLKHDIDTSFWNREKGMYADDLLHQYFSEHIQCMAVLSGMLDDDKKLTIAHNLSTNPNLATTDIYYTHYLFETYKILRLEALFYKRLEPWFELETNGYCTTPEHFGANRSDCHAWGGHPLYHFYTTVLGIRPESFGFEEVSIEPMMGTSKDVEGRMPHPKGFIKVSLHRGLEGIDIFIELPLTVKGQFKYANNCYDLIEGVNEFSSWHCT